MCFSLIQPYGGKNEVGEKLDSLFGAALRSSGFNGAVAPMAVGYQRRIDAH
jgi:hypothetical protein